MLLFREVDLFGGQARFAINGSPRRRGVTAAICARDRWRDMGGDDEPVVVLAIWLLSFLRLMTIEAANALAGVLAHLVFMNDGVLLARMPFGALAGGFDEVRVGLVGLNTGAHAESETRQGLERRPWPAPQKRSERTGNLPA
jgi:hypothetical protein